MFHSYFIEPCRRQMAYAHCVFVCRKCEQSTWIKSNIEQMFVLSCAKCIRINSENKIWKSNNRAQKHEKHWTLHFINNDDDDDDSTSGNLWNSLVGELFCASIFFFLCVLLRVFYSVLPWIYYPKLAVVVILVKVGDDVDFGVGCAILTDWSIVHEFKFKALDKKIWSVA